MVLHHCNTQVYHLTRAGGKRMLVRQLSMVYIAVSDLMLILTNITQGSSPDTDGRHIDWPEA